MSNEIILFGIVSAIPSAVVAVCFWKLVSCFDKTSSSTNRSMAKERHDYLSMIQKVMEKREVSPQGQLDLSALHAQERIAQMNLDTKEEVEASKPQEILKPKRKREPSILDDLVNTDPSTAVHQ